MAPVLCGDSVEIVHLKGRIIRTQQVSRSQILSDNIEDELQESNSPIDVQV